MASPSSSSNRPTKFEVPEGWVLSYRHTRKGKLVKSYRNILKQEFYSEFDLMRNIKYSKENGLNLYAPDFVPPATGPFAMRSKPSTNQNEIERHKGEAHQTDKSQPDEAPTEDEVQCVRNMLEISNHRSFERRVSRRVAGLRPELQVEFEIQRALEYVIKDKPQH